MDHRASLLGAGDAGASNLSDGPRRDGGEGCGRGHGGVGVVSTVRGWRLWQWGW